MKIERNKKLPSSGAQTLKIQAEKQGHRAFRAAGREDKRGKERDVHGGGGALVHGCCLCSGCQTVMVLTEILLGANVQPKMLGQFMEAMRNPSCL